METLHKRIILSITTFGCLLLGGTAGASTIVYVPDQSFVLTADGESGFVDMGGFERPMNFFARQNAVLNWNWEATVLNFHQFVGDPMRASPIRFDAGTEIGDDLFWTNHLRDVRTIASMGDANPGTFFDTEGFLAIRFFEEEFGWENEDALPFYGWIRVSHSAEDMALTVHDWAWNSAAGESILAGQIPEPAAYAVMLAAGVLGFVIFRRTLRPGIPW